MTLKFITWDVEHGSAAYIQTPNGRHIAVDLGAQRARDTGFSPLAYLYRNWGVKQLDAVVITHPHLDHIEDILNFDALSPSVLMRPSHLTDDAIWGNNRRASSETRRIIEKYIEINQRYNQPASPQTALSSPQNYGGVSFKFFIPHKSSTDNINNHSVVTVMTYAGVKLLLPGDNEPPSWDELLADSNFVSATHRPGPAAMVKVSRASNKQGQLNPRYERLARHLRAQQEQRPKANKNRRRASRSAEKQVGYKLPQIVVVQEPTHGRRVGGL